MSGTFTLFKRSAGYAVALLSGPALQYLLIPVYARILSQQEYGVVFLMVSVAGVAEILSKLSLNIPLLRLYYDQDTDAGRRRLFGTLLTLQLLLGAVIAAAAGGFAGPLNRLFTAEPALELFFVLSVVAAVFRAATNLQAGLFRLYDQVWQFSALIAGFNVIQKLVTVAAVLLSQNKLEAYFWSMAISAAVMGVLALALFYRAGGIAFEPSLARAAVWLGVPLMLNELLAWVMNLSDRVILNRFHGPDDVAVYSMGYTFGFVLSYIAGAFYTAWAPQFYARAAQHGDAPQLIEHYCTYLYLLTGLLFVIVTGASYELILTLSTAAYLPARQVIPIVAGAYTLAQIFSFAGPVMVHLKRPQILTLMTLVGAACNFGLNLLLIPQYGFIAAAWNTMAAILVVAVVEGMLSIRMYPYRLETGRLLKVTLAVAITSAVLWWTSALTAGVSHYLILTLKVAVAPVMLALLLLALRFYRRSEVAFARRILRVGAA